MKKRQLGFNTIELVISLALITIIGVGSYSVTHQTMLINNRGQAKMAVVSEVENIGYWITRDAQMAENIITSDLACPNLMIISWTEWNILEGTSVYHTVTYYFEGLEYNVGKLIRQHWSSAGTNDILVLGEHIYFSPVDSDNTTFVSYNNPELIARIVSRYKNETEEHEYRITRRVNYNWY